MVEAFKEEIPIYPVKSLSKVNLQKEQILSCLFCKVDYLVGDKNIIKDKPKKRKGSLVRINKFCKHKGLFLVGGL